MTKIKVQNSDADRAIKWCDKHCQHDWNIQINWPVETITFMFGDSQDASIFALKFS
jgi:hypothetical protein